MKGTQYNSDNFEANYDQKDDHKYECKYDCKDECKDDCKYECKDEYNTDFIESLFNRLNTMKYDSVKKNKINNYITTLYNEDRNLIIPQTSISCREMSRSTCSSQGMRTLSYEFNPF